MGSQSRYHKSAPGDFYINYSGLDRPYDRCCLAGGRPDLSAPEFCEFEEIDGVPHCFVKKQPESSSDVYQMLRAIYACEFNCLRYGGTDAEIIQRITDISIGEIVCDFPMQGKHKHKLRNHCTFELNENAGSSLMDSSRLLRAYLLSHPHWLSKRLKATPLQSLPQNGFTFSYSWTDFSEEEYVAERKKNVDSPNKAGITSNRKKMAAKLGGAKIYHRINIVRLSANTILLSHSPVEQAGSMAVSMNIHDFLAETYNVSDIRWYTEDEWNNGSPSFWRETPY